jgi:hypothetical protein
VREFLRAAHFLETKMLFEDLPGQQQGDLAGLLLPVNRAGARGVDQRDISGREGNLAQDLGIEVREQVLSRESLYLADEVFMSGTAAEITPVRSVDGIQVGEGRRGPVTKRIQEAFFGLFTGETEDKYGWLDQVNP